MDKQYKLYNYLNFALFSFLLLTCVTVPYGLAWLVDIAKILVTIALCFGILMRYLWYYIEKNAVRQCIVSMDIHLKEFTTQQ